MQILCPRFYSDPLWRHPSFADVQPGPSVTYGTPIKLDVKPTVSRVYYTVNDGREINTTKLGEYYETYPEYKGWLTGENVTVKVYAEIIYYFENLNQPFNNTIVDSSTYYFQVGKDNIGTKEPPKITLPSYKPVQVPGFEAVIFLASLIIAGLILKYRKNNRRNR